MYLLCNDVVSNKQETIYNIIGFLSVTKIFIDKNK